MACLWSHVHHFFEKQKGWGHDKSSVFAIDSWDKGEISRWHAVSSTLTFSFCHFWVTLWLKNAKNKLKHRAQIKRTHCTMFNYKRIGSKNTRMQNKRRNPDYIFNENFHEEGHDLIYFDNGSWLNEYDHSTLLKYTSQICD